MDSRGVKEVIFLHAGLAKLVKNLPLFGIEWKDFYPRTLREEHGSTDGLFLLLLLHTANLGHWKYDLSMWRRRNTYYSFYTSFSFSTPLTFKATWTMGLCTHAMLFIKVWQLGFDPPTFQSWYWSLNGLGREGRVELAFKFVSQLKHRSTPLELPSIVFAHAQWICHFEFSRRDIIDTNKDDFLFEQLGSSLSHLVSSLLRTGNGAPSNSIIDWTRTLKIPVRKEFLLDDICEKVQCALLTEDFQDLTSVIPDLIKGSLFYQLKGHSFDWLNPLKGHVFVIRFNPITFVSSKMRQ